MQRSTNLHIYSVAFLCLTSTSANPLNCLQLLLGHETQVADVVVLPRELQEQELNRSLNSSYLRVSNVLKDLMRKTTNTYMSISLQREDLNYNLSSVLAYTKKQVLALWITSINRTVLENYLVRFEYFIVPTPQLKLIVVLANESDTAHSVFVDIFTIIFSKSSRYVAVVIGKIKGRYGFAVMHKIERKLSFVTFDEYETKFSGTLFKSLPKYFDGYPLRVVFRPTPPYVMNDTEGAAMGCEQLLAITIAEVLKMTPKLVYEPNMGQIEAQHKLVRGIADLIGGIYKTGDYSYYPLIPYRSISSLVIALRPHKYNIWRSLYYQLTKGVWFAVLGTIILFVMGITFASWTYNIKSGYLDRAFEIISLHLEIGFTDSLINKTSKLLVTIMLLYTVVFTTVYKSNLKSMLTTQHDLEPILTFMEALTDHNMTYYIHLADLYNFDKLFIMAMLLGEYEVILNGSFDGDLKKLKLDGSGMIVRTNDIYDYMSAMGDFQNWSTSVLSEDSITTKNQIYLTVGNGNSLIPRLSEAQQLIIESGFVDFWYRNTFYELALKHKANDFTELKAMTLKDTTVVFNLYICLIAASWVMFILENISYYCIREFILKKFFGSVNKE